MELVVHLEKDIFELVKSGKKTIEFRVNDEKRQRLKIGDTLIFLQRPDEVNMVKTRVVDIVKYNDFETLVNFYPLEKLYFEDSSKEELLRELNRFYTKEEQDEYGVVAIHIERVDI